MTSTCMTDEEIFAIVDGAKHAEHEAHARQCAACSERLDELRRATTHLTAPVFVAPTKLAVDDVMARLGTVVPDPSLFTPPAPAERKARVVRTFVGAAAGLALLGLVTFGLLQPEIGNGDLRARGGSIAASTERRVGVHVHAGGQALVSNTTVRPDDTWSITYENGMGEPVYVLVFAIDAKGAVHWLCPVYVDAQSDPLSTPLPPSDTKSALPIGVQLESPAAGPMRVVAIVSHAVMHVKDVDTLQATELESSSLRGRWPEADVRDLATVVIATSP